ncbi:Predicted metal-binding protein [Rhizobium sp. RU35A]|nr:Predicted metal-binding protein [Rhizobium sp. RU35A]
MRHFPAMGAPLYDEHPGWILDLTARHDEQQSGAQETRRVTVHVCDTCRSGQEAADAPRDGALLSERTKTLAAEGGDVIEIRAVACLANCKRGLSASIQSADGWSYVFGDLTTEAAADLLTGARLLATSPDGLMPWKGRPDTLKRGMIARIPPLRSISPES